MTDFVLFDGGYETQLRKYVGSGFEGHPLWVSRYLTENPEACRKVFQDFIQCGSEMILTNTYQATIDGFKKHLGLDRKETLEMIKSAITICKDAIDIEKQKGNKNSVSIVGFVGPYGAHLNNGCEYAGGFYADDMTIKELADWHRPKVEALIEGGCDYLLFGTIPSPKEAEAIIEVLKEHPGFKAILSFSAQNEKTISHGEKLSEVAKRCWELAADQILAIGINCQHPRFSVPLLSSVKEANPDIPLFVKPNTTEIFNTTTKEWEPADSGRSLQEYCRDWLELGVKYIGGCCRTTVDDVSSFREEIRKFKMKND
ncbi:homocysteine S-methyltransferase YbgG-like [Homalodisca vitripennis]|nr:homocysteine S-methyltransferase YbgG-like [Homalodisca vitripennis]XP_046675707.1 homocysteine S-methyltransferase YbgG-like [Homalodisca vitripennis]XP_046675708.1 homocysteine S-methyltransferase YbgG-like [Homalodisca vitripennis]